MTLRAEGPRMIRVPEGRFIIGSTPDEILAATASCAAEPLGHRCTEHTFANELGRRTLFQDAFWIDRTEVTVAEYERCVAMGRCSPPAWSPGARRFMQPDFPVTFVSYRDAESYCRFRGAHLPSESMFERAARGPSGRVYPWGDLYNARVTNHGRLAPLPLDTTDGYAELAPVGSFPAGRTPDGILDLAGNAAEWTSDPYRDSYSDPLPEPREDVPRVVRGGSFMSAAPHLRGAARQGFAPETRGPWLGFRCAKSLGQSTGSADYR